MAISVNGLNSYERQRLWVIINKILLFQGTHTQRYVMAIKERMDKDIIRKAEIENKMSDYIHFLQNIIQGKNIQGDLEAKAAFSLCLNQQQEMPPATEI